MTKRDLIEEVARHYPRFSHGEVETVVNRVFEELRQTLARGERIEIRGLGSYGVKQRRAHQGRNPRTSEVVAVVAKKVAYFKVGKELRLRVDSKGPLAAQRVKKRANR